VTRKRLGRRRTGWRQRSVFVAAVASVSAAIGAASVASAPAATLPMPPVVLAAAAGSAGGPAPGAVFVRWAAAKDGGSRITTYGFSVSVNGGTTWSAERAFNSTALVQATKIFPAFVCSNTKPGSKGCLFRIYSTSAVGTGPPSKPVALWTVPGAPRALTAIPGSGLDTTGLIWKVPVSTGGLLLTGFDVSASMDGHAATHSLVAATVRSVTLPCTGERTCAYSVRAANSQGASPPSATVTITTAPGSPTAVTLHNAGSDPSTGYSVLDLGWRDPVTGLVVDHYDVEQCGARVGLVHSCDPSSLAWNGRRFILPSISAPLESHANCRAGYATCYMRVRGVNARGGAGVWRTLDLEPWAPFGVKVTPGATRGTVVVKFSGPAESGRSSTTALKHYRVFVCEIACTVAASWRVVSDAVPYPPAGNAPFTAGTFQCHTVPSPPAPAQTQSIAARQCQVRMQFVDGLGAAGSMSGLAIGSEHS
jgi:hypothetical protein